MPMPQLVVPLMIFVSGAFMALAWLGHLRLREYGFWFALLMSWAIVLPEYVLNVVATRYGYGTYSGAQMGMFHLCSGVICVALVSRYVLGETLQYQQLAGMALIASGMMMVLWRVPAAVPA